MWHGVTSVTHIGGDLESPELDAGEQREAVWGEGLGAPFSRICSRGGPHSHIRPAVPPSSGWGVGKLV